MTVYLDENLNPAPNKDVETLVQEGYKPYEEGDYSLYLIGAKTFVGGAFVDIPTAEYTANQKVTKIAELTAQIDELDKKRIRAGFEPSVKDSTSGQTWLEYYTLQIQELRKQVIALN